MKRFRVEVYDCTIRFFLSSKEAKAEYPFVCVDVDENNIKIVVSDLFDGIYDARFMQCLSHESNHAAMCILHGRGVNFDFHNQEVLCYLQDFIFRNCYEYCVKQEKLKQPQSNT